MINDIAPMTLYGAEFSYFTGKLEGVLRYAEIPHQRLPGSPVGKETNNIGVRQVPSLELADGRWLTDTTPIIAWLDQQLPELELIPNDPVLAFFSRLLEDYADEWLWRPAMHFRWSFEESAKHLSRVLVDENTRDVPAPAILKRYMLRNRQRAVYVQGDGVSPDNREHVEKIYYDSLAQLGAIFAQRPYLLGNRPSLADFGFFGPMFRHFAQDPTSARIMRETAPAVNEWNARLWNARASKHNGELLDHVPDDWGPILKSIGSAYLPYLNANALAWTAEQSHFDVDVEGAPYRNIRTSRYRVWCLEELRRYYLELSDAQQQEARRILETNGCWAPLWSAETRSSGLNPDPFSGGHSMTGVDRAVADKFYWLPVPKVKPKPA
ncbi:MAG: glutathione S-transferase family protein [Pseudomonadales bacterium]